MPKTVKIDKDTISELTCGVDEEDGWFVMANEYVGEWRWGQERRLIVKDVVNGSVYGFDYRTSSGDSEYRWEDHEPEQIELYEVQEVSTVAYERVK